MKRTIEQEQINNEIWTLLGQGKVGTALHTASSVLRMEPSHGNAAFRMHTAMQLFEIYKRARKNTTTPSIASEYILDELQTIRQFFPVHVNERKAEERTRRWEDILPGESGHIHAWQSVVEELEVIGILALSPELLAVSRALLSAILTYARDHDFSDRVLQILAMKRGRYADAKAAFETFVTEYGVGTTKGMFDQQAQLSSIMKGRAMWRRDKKTQRLAESELMKLSSDTEGDVATKQKILAQNKKIQRFPFLLRLRNIPWAIKKIPHFLLGKQGEEAHIFRSMGKALQKSYFGLGKERVQRL